VTRPASGLLPIIAMKQAVHNANFYYKSRLLRNMTLGYKIFDLCKSTQIQDDILKMIWTKNAMAVIGPTNFDDASLVVPVMSLYYVPMITMNEIPLEIDYRPRFDIQHWIVPQIVKTAHAVIDFVARYMKCNFIGIFYQEDTYGWTAAHTIQGNAKQHGVCVYDMVRFKVGTLTSTYHQMLTHVFHSQPRLHIIVLALQEDELIKFIDGLKMVDRTLLDQIQLIALSTWGTKQIVVNGHEEYARGVITFQAYYPPRVKSLNDFVNSGRIFKSTDYMKYKARQCKGDNRNSLCDDQNDRAFFQHHFGKFNHSNAHAIANSVNAYVAIIGMLLDAGYTNNSLIKFHGGLAIVKQFQKLSTAPNIFPYERAVFDFMKNRRIEPRVGIYNYQETVDGIFEYKQIGLWRWVKNHIQNNSSRHIGELHVHGNLIQWREYHPPNSSCSPACNQNEIRLPEHFCAQLCWECEPCQQNHVAINNTCVECQLDEVPNPKKSICEKLPVKGVRIAPAFVVLTYVFSMISMVISLAFLCGFVYFKEHHVVKASSRELSALIFLGVITWDLVPFFNLATPSKLSCFLGYMTLYLGFCLVYAPLFLKSNRVYRIFQAAKVTPIKPRVVSPSSQITISLLLCLVQILLLVPRYSVITLGQLYPHGRSHVEVYCRDNSIMFVVNFGFVCILMTGTTFYNFKTRHFPKNYNESKYVGVAMYITCFVSTIGLVSYFLVQDEGAKCILPTATGVFCGYIVLFGIYARRFVLIYREAKEEEQETDNDRKNEIEQSVTTIVDNDNCLSVNGDSPRSPRSILSLRRLSDSASLFLKETFIGSTEKKKEKDEDLSRKRDLAISVTTT